MSRRKGISRRSALQAGMAGGLLGALSRTTFAAAPPWMQSNDHKLLTIFLRGGCDIANTLVPVADTAYNATSRPTLFMQRSSMGGPLLPLMNNSFCELNPALAPLQGLMDAGRLVAVHAAGNTVRTGSHFSDMRTWETAITGCTSSGADPEEGWVTRVVSEVFPGGFKAASVSNGQQQLFRTRPNSVGQFNGDRVLAHIKALRDFPDDVAANYSLDTSNSQIDDKLKGTNAGGVSIGLRALFTGGTQPGFTKDAFARRVGEVLLDSEAAVDGILGGYTPLGGAKYPFGKTGAAPNSAFAMPSTIALPAPMGTMSDSGNVRRFFMYLRDAMAMLRLVPEIRCVGIEIGGFDTHAKQGSVNGSGIPEGRLAQLLQAVAFGLESIDKEETHGSFEPASLTTLVFSEFGRTSKENQSKGTDHGGATAIWVAGSRAQTQAGSDPIYNGNASQWPGLFSANGADFGCSPQGNAQPKDFIQVVTDFRAVFGEAIRDVFGASDPQLNAIIPGYLAEGLAQQELGCIT